MRKKRKIAISIAILTLVIISCILYNNFNYNKKNEVTFREIEFPKFAGYINDNLKTKVKIDEKSVRNKKVINSYYTTKSKISTSRKKTIKNSFNMKGVTEEVQDSAQRSCYRKGKEQLEIYENGVFTYKRNVSRNESDMKPVKKSDSECKKIASDFLNKNDILPEEFEFYDIGETVVENLSTNEKCVVTKDIYFKRKIDGIAVEGDTKIVVNVDGEGIIDSVYSSFREIDKEVKVNNVLSVDDAIDNLPQMNGQVYINDNADQVTFDDIEVVYYEQSNPTSDNITIQPVYRIKGTCLKDGKVIDDYQGITYAIKN